MGWETLEVTLRTQYIDLSNMDKSYRLKVISNQP